MGSFKQVEQTDPIELRYINKVVVYLESEDDLLILKDRWFFDAGEQIEFDTVDTEEGSGGCTNVMRKVREDRNRGVEAFGIVDRDALLRECQWDLFFETNDDRFDNSAPFGNEVTVLRRWELESYLLVPEVVTDYLSDAKDGRQRSVTGTIEEMLDCAEVLTPQIAANFLLHEQGRSSLPESFGNDLKTADDMFAAVDDHLSTNKVGHDRADLEGYAKKIESFADNQPEGSPERWDRLNRMIDAKLFMRRFFRTKHSLDSEHRFHLATKIRYKKCIDEEISEHIRRFSESQGNGSRES
jgi:hypothetical protein